MYKRPIFEIIHKRLLEPRRFIQVLSGPRQVGKTTLIRQMMDDIRGPVHYASADEPTVKDRVWIDQQWEAARLKVREERKPGLLALDEIQKISGWSETVKRLWEEDGASGLPLNVAVLGSSPLLVEKGLTESLAGRFEIVPVTHWSFREMEEAFGWDIDRFLYYGGYPGAAGLIDEPQRWARYILDSLIETTISRDILLMTRVDKPALLRRLFDLGCAYSGQVLSYQKMLGQLQDAGNTVTLAHYLDLLRGAGMMTGLAKYSGRQVRQRGSSPKLLVLNTALMTAASPLSFEEAKRDKDFWGRLVETAVGAHLVARAAGTSTQVQYWAGANREVDLILTRGKDVMAIEVKSGRRRTSLPGMDVFCREFPEAKKLLVGAQGLSLDVFLRMDSLPIG